MVICGTRIRLAHLTKRLSKSGNIKIFRGVRLAKIITNPTIATKTIFTRFIPHPGNYPKQKSLNFPGYRGRLNPGPIFKNVLPRNDAYKYASYYA
jgi:hypothetical protein